MMQASMIHVSMMYEPMIHVSMMHVSMMHLSTMLVSMMNVSVVRDVNSLDAHMGQIPQDGNFGQNMALF